jgi:hypothetical protein
MEEQKILTSWSKGKASKKPAEAGGKVTSSALKMETTCSFETSGSDRITWRYNTDDRIIHFNIVHTYSPAHPLSSLPFSFPTHSVNACFISRSSHLLDFIAPSKSDKKIGL